jgi:D-3-phosphoglycerate dehydrogenase
MEQVILTPHVAWYSEESAAEMRTKAAMGVVDVLLYGKYPQYLVNTQVKEKVRLNEHGLANRDAVEA